MESSLNRIETSPTAGAAGAGGSHIITMAIVPGDAQDGGDKRNKRDQEGMSDAAARSMVRPDAVMWSHYSVIKLNKVIRAANSHSYLTRKLPRRPIYEKRHGFGHTQGFCRHVGQA